MAVEQVSDYELIRRGVTEAERERKSITDGVARVIASQLHIGQDSAMYSLASTGHIDEQLLIDEISYELGHSRLDGEERDAVRHLGLYVLRHGDRPKVEGWSDLWG